MSKTLDSSLITYEQMLLIDPKDDGYQRMELEGRTKFYQAFHNAKDVRSIVFTSPQDRYNPADCRIDSGGTFYWVSIKTRLKRYDEWVCDVNNLNEILDRKNKRDKIYFCNIYQNEVLLWNARIFTGKITRWAPISSVEDQGRKVKVYCLYPESTATKVILPV